MDLYVLNKSLETTGVIDSYESLIWTPRYYTYGDFELYLPATDYNIKLIASDGNEVNEEFINYQICKDNAKNCEDVKTLSDMSLFSFEILLSIVWV